jgi:hypothetical protein
MLRIFRWLATEARVVYRWLVKPVRRRLREGFAYSIAPPEWIRGPAIIDGDEVVLEDRQRERYQPHTHAGEMLVDLAGISEPHDILRFVRQYGLLRHGPDANNHREALEEWRIAAGWLRSTLAVAVDLADSLNGVGSAYDNLRENELVRLHAANGEPPVLHDELESIASAALAHAVTAGLGDVRTRIVSDMESVDGATDPGRFRYFFEPDDLLGHLFASAAHLIVQRAPLARCPECGRYFAVEHGRQQFCTPSCASRARYKRFAAKRKKERESDER